jgi:hypothetical protein
VKRIKEATKKEKRMRRQVANKQKNEKRMKGKEKEYIWRKYEKMQE